MVCEEYESINRGNPLVNGRYSCYQSAKTVILISFDRTAVCITSADHYASRIWACGLPHIYSCLQWLEFGKPGPEPLTAQQQPA